MERQIRFRGKRKDTGEWVYGDLVRNVEVSAFCIKFTDSKKVGTRSLGSWINQLGAKIELYGQ